MDTWLMRSSGTTDAGTIGLEPTMTPDPRPRPMARRTRPRGRLCGREDEDCDVAVLVNGVVWLLLRLCTVAETPAPLVAVTVPSATDTAGFVYLFVNRKSNMTKPVYLTR